jgi:hypothetical protein
MKNIVSLYNTHIRFILKGHPLYLTLKSQSKITQINYLNLKAKQLKEKETPGKLCSQLSSASSSNSSKISSLCYE